MALTRTLQTKGVVGRWAVYAFVGALCFGLGGCEETQKIREGIDQKASEAQKTLEEAQKKPPRTVNYDPLTVSNKVWSGNAALRMHRGLPLPSRYEDERGVTLVSAEPMSLNDIASSISAQTGIPIRLSALTIPGRGGAAASPSGPATPGAPSASGSDMPISYEGPLSGLLDRLGAFFGVSWRFDGSVIAISRFETRIFVVEAMPGSQEINEGMQDDSSSSSGGGSSSSGSGSSSSSSSASNTLTQNSKTTISLKYWEELTSVLNSIVGGQGSAIVSPTMGTVTVTTTPDVMATVSDYLSKENKRLSRQIAINVQVYNVSLGKTEDFSLAFSGFLRHLSGQISGINYTPATISPIETALSGPTGLANLSVAIIKGTSDPMVGTNEVFRALSTVGDTSQVAQFSMTTLNNRPVSRRVGTDTAYIQSVTQNTTTGTTSTTVLTPVIATIHEGFSLQLTPRLLDDGRILLQYSLGLIGLKDIGSITFEGNQLSLPETENRLFVQQSMLRSGHTLVIAGVDQETMQQNKQGVGSPDNFLLGGGVSSKADRVMMFMMITPQVMDVSSDEERN
jgi:type IVB pilus formation R64 PilN family outer membrane protein